MKNKVKNYVDYLFKDIKENKQLRELKEEISANLLDKVNDYISSGLNEEGAFDKAVSGLGDMSELIENLQKVSMEKEEGNMNTIKLDKVHVFGYVIATATLIFGLLTSLMLYFMQDLFIAIASLMPFAVFSIPVLVFLGLTQESQYTYGMKKGRAFLYALATATLIFGVIATAITYIKSNDEYMIFAVIMPFALPSISLFTYLGLTEKSRLKMTENWQNKWINYYKDPQFMQLRGLVSGALWVFSIAVFILLCFLWKWYYAWIIFVFSIGGEILIELFFSAKYKNKQ